MKLSEVQVRDKVPTGIGSGDYTNRMEAKRDWTLTFEQGVVTATLGKHVLLIPVANVIYMKPAVGPDEPKKTAKAA